MSERVSECERERERERERVRVRVRVRIQWFHMLLKAILSPLI